MFTRKLKISYQFRRLYELFPFKPFPNFNNKTFVIASTFTLKDDLAIFKIRSNEIAYKYIAKTTQKNIKEAQAFITKTNKGIANEEFMYWAITLKETQELVGTICLWNFSKDKLVAEVGYELLPV